MKARLLVAICLSVSLLGSGQAVSLSSGTVVMSGLANPRGLAFGPEGALYVAEAGQGGTGPCSLIRGVTQCAGTTGAVSRLWQGVQERIATGLPSYAATTGFGATGPHDISLHGRGGAYVTVGLGGNPPTMRAIMGQGFGRTVRLPASGNWRYDQDIAGYEEANNPDGSAVTDSNPYGILAQAGGVVLTDAGGNYLLQVDSNGSFSTLGVFPSRPQGRGTDAVPTSVAVGPDSAYYVGELSGVPFAVGAARVYRVVPGDPPQVYQSGFTAIIDIAWGPDDHLYILQHASGPGLSGPGVLYRVESDGTKTPVVTGLAQPGGVAFGPEGAIYISNLSTNPIAGEVLRFEP